MSQNRTIKAILALDYDKRALSGTQKAIDQLNASLDGTRKRALTVETAASSLKKELVSLAREDAIEQIGRDFARAGTEGKDFNDTVRETIARLQAVGASETEIRGVARAYQAAAREANQLAKAEGGGGRRAALGALGTFGREVKALPSIRLGPISTDQIGKILQTVDAGLIAIGATAATVAAATAIAAPALIALAVAMDQFFKGIDAGKKIVESALAAQDAYYLALRENTTQDTIEQVAELNRIRPFLQAQRDETQNAIDANGGPGNPVTAQLVEQLAELDAQLLTNDQTVQRLTTGLEINAFAAGDQLAAQTELAKAIQRTTLASMEAEQFARTNTVEATQARIDTLKNEVAQLEASNRAQQVFNSAAANEIIAHNNALIAEKNAAINATQAVIGLSSAFEASNFFKGITENGRGVFEGALSAVGNAFGGVVEGAINQVDRLGDIQQKITDAETKTSTAIQAINAKLAEAESKALADRDQGLADAQEKYNDAREKQETAHRDRLLAINRRADMTLANAIGERDALAYFMGQQQRQTELKEENTANKRRLQEIDKALKQQNAQVLRRYNEQVEAARKAANASIAIENEKLRVLQQQLNAEIATINAAAQQRLALQSAYWNASLATDVAGANSALSVISQFWNGVISTVSGGAIQHSSTPIIPTITPYSPGGGSGGMGEQYAAYANGGYPPVNQRVLVGEQGPELAVFTSPARVYSANQTRAGAGGGGGATINMNVEGATVKTIEVVSRSQAMGVFGDVLTGLGL